MRKKDMEKDNFILQYVMDDTTICDQLIDYHKNDTDYKRRGITAGGMVADKISTDVCITPSNQNPAVIAYMKELCSVGIKNYCEAYAALAYNLGNQIGIKEPWNIQYYKPKEGYFNWHCERSCYQSDQRALVFMTYLNDVTDGGETEFYYQKKKIKAVKGKTVIWPTDFTHTHRGIVSPTEHKYIATGWFNFFDVIDMDRHYTEAGLPRP